MSKIAKIWKRIWTFPYVHIKSWWIRRKLKKQYKKKLEELRKRDPFIYKNH
jgi:hypothetical protein